MLSVLGVASSDEGMRASVPRIISELAQDDTLHDEFALRVFLAAAIDPSLQTASRQTAPLIYYIALCGDRPQGEPKAGNRMLCDALGVPFSGQEAIDPVSSPIPTLLISSGYDAQTPPRSPTKRRRRSRPRTARTSPPPVTSRSPARSPWRVRHDHGLVLARPHATRRRPASAE